MSDNFDLMALRRRARISTTDLAEFFGCSVSAVSRFESGERKTLPGGRGREDYIAAVEHLSAEAQKAGRS